MASSFARLVPFFAVLLPLATGCGSIVRTDGTDDAGSDSGSGGGSCTGSNPGCCGLATDGCEGLVAEATCSDASAWTCPSGETVGPACSTICRAEPDGGDVCVGEAPGCCADDCTKPAVDPICTSSGWTCPSGSREPNGDVCSCVSDAGGGGVSCGSLLCDPSTEYCYVSEGGAVSPSGGSNFNASCEAIPTGCLNDPAGAAAACACTLAESNGARGQCSKSGDGFTITAEKP